MKNESRKKNWGNPPWQVEFRAEPRALPDVVNFAVVGGGFTGCAAAAWLRHLNPEKSVALFEAETIGVGASGHTGGMALEETAAGDLPGLGKVLEGVSRIHRELGVDCDWKMSGVWELGRGKALRDSQIHWKDSGDLHVVAEVPGGTLDPGKQVGGLARAAAERGAAIYEHSPVDDIRFTEPVALKIGGKEVRAEQVLIATNAMSLELGGLEEEAQSKFTLAVATEALSEKQLKELGVASGKPFYTTDLPYLWGRLYAENQLIFGSGLVQVKDWRELNTLDVAQGEAAELFKRLERRIRGLYPVLENVAITRRWGGPILIGEKGKPVFRRHPKSSRVIVSGAYSGHGVALSVYLGAWAAEVMLGKRGLPEWD